MAGTTLGIPWFRREDYQHLLLIFADASYFPTSYDDWLAKAVEHLQELDSSGVGTIKVIIDLDHFPAWCAANGKNLDSEARNSFAWVQAMREFRQGN